MSIIMSNSTQEGLASWDGHQGPSLANPVSPLKELAETMLNMRYVQQMPVDPLRKKLKTESTNNLIVQKNYFMMDYGVNCWLMLPLT